MKKISDQVLARRMLLLRDRGGYGLGAHLRMNARRHVFVALYFMAALAFFAARTWWTAFALVLGMVLGMYLRDLGWIRSSRKTWPFTKQIIDWTLVRKLAEPQSATSNDETPGSEFAVEVKSPA